MKIIKMALGKKKEKEEEKKLNKDELTNLDVSKKDIIMKETYHILTAVCQQSDRKYSQIRRKRICCYAVEARNG